MNQAELKTVRDIYVEALVLKRQRLSPMEIKERLIDIAQDNGFGVTERGAAGGSQPTQIELQFSNGESIYYDGADWHHVRQ